MQQSGSVISVSLETDVKKKDGGTYKGWELVYRSDEGEVKTIAKPVQGLKFNENLKKQLGSLAVGDHFVVTMEKNANNFWEVESVIKGEKREFAEPTPTAGTNKAPTRVVGSTYETAEERKIKQRYIVRQSAIAQAVNVHSVGAKVPPEVAAVLATADKFVEYVYFEDAVQSIKEMTDDIPY